MLVSYMYVGSIVAMTLSYVGSNKEERLHGIGLWFYAKLTRRFVRAKAAEPPLRGNEKKAFTMLGDFHE